jgi:putative membrane protein
MPVIGALALTALLATASVSGAQSTVPEPDRHFATEAAAGGMAEVELGRLATQKATAPAVKQFAERLVADHTAANATLTALAKQKGLTLPSEPGAEHRALQARLEQAPSGTFDQMYMTEMIRDHEKDVAAFEREAQSGQDPELRAWAAQTVPTLREHLRMAQNIHAVLAGGSATPNVPAASVATVTTPWCGGAYLPTTGTNFGSCPTAAPSR